MPTYHLAQVNVAQLKDVIDSPLLADFVAELDPVNALADVAPGFVWRLQTEDGNATAISGFEDDIGDSAGVIVNMSVWESVEDLAAFVFSPEHLAIMRRRREFFEKMTDAYLALWWVPAGHVPTVAEAEERVAHLRRYGATPYAFTMRTPLPAPGDIHAPQPRRETCPA
jgi:hypothetical protein